jgi:hypothetical protein
MNQSAREKRLKKELIAHYSHKHPQSVARAAAALEQRAD